MCMQITLSSMSNIPRDRLEQERSLMALTYVLGLNIYFIHHKT